MWAWTLLERTYCFNQNGTKVSLYLDNLRPQVNIEALSGRALVNDTQWFILVTLKDIIPKDELH